MTKKIQLSTVRKHADVQVIILNASFAIRAYKCLDLLKNAKMAAEACDYDGTNTMIAEASKFVADIVTALEEEEDEGISESDKRSSKREYATEQ